MPDTLRVRCRQLQGAFQQLSKLLRSLTLALDIVAVQPISAASRRTALLPPAPHPLATAEPPRLGEKDAVQRCLEPVEVLVQLEGSGEPCKQLLSSHHRPQPDNCWFFFVSDNSCCTCRTWIVKAH